MPSIQSIPEAWASWEPRTFRHLCIKSWLHHAHAFVAAAEKTCHMQRSRGSGREVVVSKICYNTVIVLSVVLCDCCKPTNNCRDWDFSNGKLDVCLPAFRLPMFAKRDTAKMWFLGHSCLRNPCLFWNLSVHSPPEAWGPWERQYAPPALHYTCIMLAKDPWVGRVAASLSAADVRKMWCTAERRCVGHVCLRFNCRDWAFSKSELDVWLPAFQLPMSAKRDALPKRGLCDMFVKGNPCLLWTSKDPIPTRSLRWLWWLHHACKRSSFGIQDVDYRILIVISVVLYSDSCKSMKNCRDSASSYF